jgi:hypothetical protein
VAWVCERTIPTERPPLVGEVSAKFWGQMVSATDPYGRILGFLDRSHVLNIHFNLILPSKSLFPMWSAGLSIMTLVYVPQDPIPIFNTLHTISVVIIPIIYKLWVSHSGELRWALSSGLHSRVVRCKSTTFWRNISPPSLGLSKPSNKQALH